MTTRFKVILSPYIERDVVRGVVKIPDLIDDLIQIKNLCLKLNHFLFFYIPIPVKLMLYADSRGRSFVNLIELNRDSNIFFDSFSQDEKCPEPDVGWNFSSFCGGGLVLHSVRAIQRFLYQNRVPLVIDIGSRVIHKDECDRCGIPSLLCSSKMDILSFIATNDKEELLRDFLADNEEEVLHYLRNERDCSLLTIKYTAFILSFFEGMNVEDINKINNIEVIDSFLLDIRKCDSETLKEIAYCGFLALFFPSLESAGGDAKFKVRWHSETSMKECGGVKLFRAYVLPRNSLGFSQAGVKRILIGEKSGVKKLLAYTDSHDFSPDLIKARVLSF